MTETQIDFELPAPPKLAEVVSRGEIERLKDEVFKNMRSTLNAHTNGGDVVFPDSGKFLHAVGEAQSRVMVELTVKVIPRETT